MSKTQNFKNPSENSKKLSSFLIVLLILLKYDILAFTFTLLERIYRRLCSRQGEFQSETFRQN